MLKIKPEQIQAFERVLSRRAYEHLRVAIETALPGTNGEGRRVLERGLKNAASYGIDDDADLAAFIVLGLALRPAGAERPVPEWIAAWLNRPETPGATKMAVIEAQLAQFGSTDPELRRVAEQVAAARRCIDECRGHGR